MKMIPLTILMIATLGLANGCSRNLSSSTVTSSNTVAKVVYGTVISSRQVTVKEADRLQDNALGGLAGGVAGGVAGSAVGGGTGRSLATVGGAIAGAVLGAAIQDEFGTSTGTEYVVQLDSSAPARTTATRTKEELDLNRGNSVKNDINDSLQMNDTAAQAIAVVQQDEVAIAPGSRVMVIYSDDRPRVVPVER